MRWLALLLVLLGGCYKGPPADLASIGEARSLFAEWALVNELAANGQTNATYTAAMHQQLRQQLQTAATSLKQPDSDYGVAISACLHLPDDSSPAELRLYGQTLKQIEDSLESA
jgi:hypothetical protein